MELPREISAKRGLSLSYKGKILLSKVDPIGQAEKIIQSLDVKERTLYLCPSPLYGYGLSHLLDRIHKSSAVLCVEADKHLFDIALKSINCKDPRFHFALVEPSAASAGAASAGAVPADSGSVAKEAAQEVCSLVNKIWEEHSFQRIELIRLNGGWQLYPEHYESIKDLLQKDISLKWTNTMIMIRLGRLYIKNTIRNLSLLPKSRDISLLNFHEAPILVLGAGPSADLILDKISLYKKTNKRPFRIICVDSCLTLLKERGIEPDLAVILESQHVNLRSFLNSKQWGVKTLVDLSSLPLSATILGSDYYFGFTPWTSLKIFKRLEAAGLLPVTLTPLGSVGLTAVELALKFGSGPVVTAGIDFSYNLDSSYSRSSPVHLSRLVNNNCFNSLLNADNAFRKGTYTLKSKSGHTVRTDPVMMNYRNLYENEFGSNPRLFDISGPGLFLGTNTIAADKVFDLLNTSAASAGLFVSGEKVHISSEQVVDFVTGEIGIINEIKNILSGNIPLDELRLDKLLDDADYLWAHFPDYRQQIGAKDLSFYKRVRMEIEPFLKLWDMTLKSL